jgi:hypothetical protein
MATKTLRVFAEYTSTGFVPMPTAGNIDYGYTLGSTFPATTPTSFQTDNPDLVVTVTAMTDFYVWIRVNGQAWNPSYTRNVRVYPDSPNINNVVMNMIIATGPAGVSSYTQIVQTSNRLYFNGATTDSIYNSKFAGKTYINELNFGTAPGLATVATSGAYADLTGKPTLATVATSGLFTDLSSKPSGTAPLSYNSGTNSFVITQANTSTNGYLSSTDWNTFNNKFATPAGTTLQYVDGTGALQTFPVLASADKLVINVRNSSGVSMPKGSVVYINGATGNKPTVALSQANSDATSAQTLGLLQSTLANNAEGNVIIVGAVTDLNTSAFTEGQQLYLSPTTAGAYTATKQYAPNHLVYVGVVTRSHVSLGTIEVKVQNGYEMDELHNVSAQSPSNNDGLFYNTTTSLWEKKSITTVLGYTPYNGTDTSIKALFSASAPLSYSNGVYGISQATTSSNGYLSSTDWNTFNGKESVLSFTTPLVRTTNTISINQASASTSGYLSSTDWNTFNNKGTGTGSVTSVAMTMPLGLSVSGSPITTSGTFGITLTAGYVIPSTTSTSEWNIAYNNRITSLTITGSSGSATLASNVLNIPTYTLVGLGGQPALNGTGFVKISGTTISYDNSTYLTTASASSTYQTIITNPITGTGTINELAYFNSATSIASLAVATYPSLTELAYVKGVTSAIQTQLNAKAATLSGTTNYVAKFTSSTGIGNSQIFDNGTNIGISTITPASKLDIQETAANAYATIIVRGNNRGGGIDMYNGTTFLAQIYADSSSNIIFTNGASFTERFRIASTGASTFSNSVTSESTGVNASLRIKNTTASTGRDWHLYSLNNGNFGVYNNTLGAYALQITSSGNLGVGTSSASSPLTFYQSAYNKTTLGDARVIRLENSDPTVQLNSRQEIGFGYSTAYQPVVIGHQITNNNDFTNGSFYVAVRSGIGNTAPIQALTVAAGGNLGINTASPQSKLHVVTTGTTFTPTSYGSIGGSVAQRVHIQSNEPGLFLSSDSNAANTSQTGTQSYVFGLQLATYGSGDFRSQVVFGSTPLTFVYSSDQGSNATERMRINQSGNVTINYVGDPGYRLYVSGAIYATSNITANSDLTLKKNLKLIDNPIDKLMQLNGYAYQWKANDEHQYGVIAQEVEKILPYAVSTGLDGIKGVSYNQLTPLLIEGFKSHESEITILKARVKYLESKLA